MSGDGGALRGTLARLAIPTFAAIIGDQLLGIADTIVIGTFGAQALAAITGATTVFVVLVLTLHGLMQGAGILGAQAIGAGDRERFGEIVRAAFVVPAVLAVAIGVATLWCAKPALRALIGPLPTVDAGAAYLVLRCCSLPGVVISGLAYTVLGAAGDTRFGLKLLVCINAVHIPLLLVLARGWGTQHPLGIVGAGLSSLCAEGAGALYALNMLRRRTEYYVFARSHVDVRLAARILWLGLPEAVYLFLVVAPDIAIVAILAPLGVEAIAAFRVLTILSDVTWSVPGSLGFAAQIVIGQRFGAHDIAGARTFERGALRYGLSLSTACGLVVGALAWPIAFVCTLDARVASIAAAPLAAHMLTLPLKGYALVGGARIRAAGDTRFSMFVGILASVIIVPGAWIAVHALHAGLFAYPLAWLAAWLMWCAATALRLERFDWKAAHLAA